jgi:homeobox-leucine zipper protein
MLQVTAKANSDVLILQEATSDLSCSLVVYSLVEKNIMCSVLDGADNSSSVFLLPSGFTILPDGHGMAHRAVAASSSSSTPTGQNTAGSILTAVYQAILPSSVSNHSLQTMEDAGNRVCQAISQIVAAVGADNAIPA